MSKLHWRYKVLGCVLLLVGFCVLGYYTRVPKLGPDAPDDTIQKERERNSRQYSQEAFDRLREKYGDQ